MAIVLLLLLCVREYRRQRELRADDAREHASMERDFKRGLQRKAFRAYFKGEAPDPAIPILTYEEAWEAILKP